MTYVSRAPLYEVWHPGGFLVSQPRGHRHIDRGLISGATKVLPGTVLGLQTTGATAVAAALGTNTGNGTFGAITPVTVPTQIGVYSVLFTAATAFTVTAPSGATATGSTGVAFSALGIGFTITAGGTAFAAGDTFAITTTAAVGKPTAAAVAGGSNVGNGTSSAVTTTGYAPTLGVYTVEFDDATHFIVSAPNGQEIGHGVTGTAFSGGGLNFTITAGGTAFVPGDSFTIVVAAGAGKWVPCTATAVDGSQNAAGICFGVSDATLNDVYGAIVTRSCEVNASELVWDSSMNAASQAAALVQLTALGIIPR
ncbi:bacteriophage lambda head decoration protein D [Paraburkholderia fungorum]|uniref:head decoration protein n=1 Tax=Paraburkholderia fungorum TaxID=134537 RepID=UPI000D05ADC9|nr:head decoration protein [Paraburkholderia fungorum]PRZ56176.1 bacteriophage lambda head decoration protein D [Paraburkholderia fungorum]